MTIRELFMENFAADLEYHTRRAVLYFILAVASLSISFFSTPDGSFAAVRLIFALGSLPLFVKGIFLLRKSSEGFGLSGQELADLADRAKHKNLPSIAAQASEVVQDFLAGPFLLWPILNLGRDIDHSRSDPPGLTVFLAGAAFLLLGVAIRRMSAQSPVESDP